MTSTNLSPANGSGAMFDRIAGRYDLLNRLMSFGIDRGWRKKLINSMPNQGRLLDVATGTADVAISLAVRHPETEITGLDPSCKMLEFGQTKVDQKQLSERIELVVGDGQALPFPDDHFAGSTIAFGIRNGPDRFKGLQEMTRVTQPGGKVGVLELSEPDGGIMSALARIHVHYVVPLLGRILSGQNEYQYLQSSIEAFPPAETFKSLMEDAGLVDVEVTRLTFGTAHLYIGRVP